MADNILDIVHRISYEITGQERIATVQRQFQSNVETIARNTVSLARLQAQLNQTTDPRRQNLLTQAIANRTRVINEQGQAIQRTIQTDRTFQQSLQREIGIINELNGRLNSLRTSRNSATSTADIRNYDRQIRAAEREMRRASGGGILGGVQSSILQGIGIGSGIQIFDTVIGKIGELISESSRLAAEVEGVRPAFERLNDPNLLQGLRDATKGTVSDLELMKQAVQFSNFGLPVERLAEALKFARIRARETGQSVDYLVQSIVMGIGRQSVLILDNLGINARRIREEFEMTGDFSAAAFKIISEESAKAGADVDTFAEKLARINAEIENNEAELGGYFNFIKSGFISIGKDVASFVTTLATAGKLGDADFNNTRTTIEQLDLRVKAEEEAASRRNAVNAAYILDYKRFGENINVLDLNSRNERLASAEMFYNKSIADAKAFYGEDIVAFNNYVYAQTQSFNRLKALISSAPVNLATISADNITSATQNQLKKAQESLQQQLGDIGNDPTAIATNLRQQQAISNVLKRYEPPDIPNAIRSKIRSPKIKPEDFDKLRAQIIAGYRKINADLAKELADPSDYITDTSFASNLIGNAYKELSDRPTQQQIADAATYSIKNDQNDFQAKKDQKDKEDYEDLMQQRVDATKQAYAAIVENASIAINTILDKQIAAYDAEIAARQGNIEKARELAQRGNVTVLEEEEEQLKKLTAERENAARRQVELNRIIQISQMAVNVAEAIGAVISAAKGDPYLLAARVIAAAAAVTGAIVAITASFSSSNNALSSGFAEGGFTGNGGKHEAAGTVHKGEFVFNKETTSKYRDVFEQIHRGAVPMVPEMFHTVQHPLYLPLIPKMGSEASVSRKELKRIASKLDGVIDAVDNIKITANQSLGVNGFIQSVEKQKRADRNRFG